jgi:hypothetical protein
VEQTRRLIEQDEVLLMFNPLGTPTSLAVIKYLNQRHIPHLFLSTGASVFGEYRTYPWTMGLQPNYRTETHLLTKYIMKNIPDAKVALLYQNDDSGRDFRQGVHEGFGDQLNKFIVKEVSYEPSDRQEAPRSSVCKRPRNVFLNLVPVKLPLRRSEERVPGLAADDFGQHHLLFDRNRNETGGRRERKGSSLPLAEDTTRFGR